METAGVDNGVDITTLQLNNAASLFLIITLAVLLLNTLRTGDADLRF
jgi:hypothetical protein